MRLIVRDWDKHFEVSQSRRAPRVLNWFPCPNDLSSDGYTMIMQLDDGQSIYGGWIILCALASKSRDRGRLMRGSSGAWHDAASIARIARAKTAAIQRAIDVLIDVGWIVDLDAVETASAAPPAAKPRKVPAPRASRSPVVDPEPASDGLHPRAILTTWDASFAATRGGIPYVRINAGYEAKTASKLIACMREYQITMDEIEAAFRRYHLEPFGGAGDFAGFCRSPAKWLAARPGAREPGRESTLQREFLEAESNDRRNAELAREVAARTSESTNSAGAV